MISSLARQGANKYVLHMNTTPKQATVSADLCDFHKPDNGVTSTPMPSKTKESRCPEPLVLPVHSSDLDALLLDEPLLDSLDNSQLVISTEPTTPVGSCISVEILIQKLWFYLIPRCFEIPRDYIRTCSGSTTWMRMADDSCFLPPSNFVVFTGMFS